MARNDLQHMLESWCHVEGRAWPAEDTAAGLIHGLSLEWGTRAIVGYRAAGMEGGSC